MSLTQVSVFYIPIPTIPNRYLGLETVKDCVPDQTIVTGIALFTASNLETLSDLNVLQRVQLCPGTTNDVSINNPNENIHIHWDGNLNNLTGLTITYNGTPILNPTGYTHLLLPCGTSGVFTQGLVPCSTGLPGGRQLTTTNWWIGILLIILLIVILIIIFGLNN